MQKRRLNRKKKSVAKKRLPVSKTKKSKKPADLLLVRVREEAPSEIASINSEAADELKIKVNAAQQKDGSQNFQENNSDEAAVARPKELTWEVFFESASYQEDLLLARSVAPAVARSNFCPSGRQVSLAGNHGKQLGLESFIESLPGDFLLFYRRVFGFVIGFFLGLLGFIARKVVLFGEICLWCVETVGRMPIFVLVKFFVAILFILSLLERILTPPLKLVSRFVDFFFWGLKNYYYCLRQIYCRVYGSARRVINWFLEAPSQMAGFFKPNPPVGWLRMVTSFVIVCVMIVLPFLTYIYFIKFKATQGLVLGAAASAYEQLQQAQQATSAFDFGRASEAFKKANQNFSAANEEIEQLNFMIKTVIDAIPQGASAKKLLEAGQDIAVAGEELTSGLNSLIAKSQFLTTRNSSNDPAEPFGLALKLQFFREKLDAAYPRINAAELILDEVSLKTIPEGNQVNFLEIKKKVDSLNFAIKKLRSFIHIFGELIGDSGSRRYLVIFQNEAELRPTGGFIGSFALIDVSRGQIKKLEIPGGGPYDLRGSLLERVAPPKPLQKINEIWQMQDANWFPDFPSSAQKIMWFYENAGGPSVDGVIALNSGLVAELLKITGPIEMPEYGKVINDENFQSETQMAVEVEFDREKNQPKQFIADLTPKLLNQLLSGFTSQALQILTILDQALAGKQILFYFNDKAVESEAISQGWAGEIKKVGPSDDYLLVVNTNIGGNKTDSVIEQKIFHEAKISETDGSIIDTVTIIRTHRGKAGERFVGGENYSYVRVYVPNGSLLLETSGFTPLGPGHFRPLSQDLENDKDLARIEGQVLVEENTGTRITNEFGKTVFGNYLVLAPGETITAKLVYKLPFKIGQLTAETGKDQSDIFTAISQKITRSFNFAAYTLLIQKQPGAANDDLHAHIIFPKDLIIRWLEPTAEKIGQDKTSVQFKSRLVTDKYFGAIFSGE